MLREEARQGGEETAADDAMRHEEAAEATGTVMDDSESDRPEDALSPQSGAQRRITGRRTRYTSRRGAWSGKNWAKEAWTGPVAAAEYAEAWRAGVPPHQPGSAAADAARRAAQQASLDANNMGNPGREIARRPRLDSSGAA